MPDRIQKTLILLLLTVAMSLPGGCRKADRGAPAPSEEPPAPRKEAVQPAPSESGSAPAEPSAVPPTAVAKPTPAAPRGSVAAPKVVPSPKNRGAPANATAEERVKQMREAEQRILGHWRRFRSLSVTVTTDSDQKEGIKQKREGSGTIDYLKTEGGTLIRMKVAERIIATQPDGNQVLTGERTLKVFDGEFLHYLQELTIGKFVSKSPYKRGDLPSVGGGDLIRQIHTLKNVRFDSDYDLEGLPTYRFSTWNDAYRATYAVDKGTGLLARMRVNGLKLQYKAIYDFTDYVVNPAFDEGHFTFVAPPDAEIQGPTISSPAAPPEAETP